MSSRPRRSVLYVPGDKPRALEKARSLPCDAVILDLEDSVLPDAKAQARTAIVAALSGSPFAAPERLVRVNALGTPWCEDDLAAVAQSPADGVLLPKVGSPDDVWQAKRLLMLHRGASSMVQPPVVWAMIETAQGVLQADAIAGALGAGGALVVGANDLAKDLRLRVQANDRQPLTVTLSLTVLAARSHGLECIDAVHNGLAADDAFEAECRHGRALGFDGKSIIHPAQIEATNRIFGPSDDELEEAALIVEAFARPENRGRGVIQVNGRMVERLHLDLAERVLASAPDLKRHRPG
jgi:citrate lyase beta subunit